MCISFLGKQRSPYAVNTTGDGLEDQEGDSRYLLSATPTPHVVYIPKSIYLEWAHGHVHHLPKPLYFYPSSVSMTQRSSIHNAVCHCQLKWLPGVPGMFKCQFKGCVDIDLKPNVTSTEWQVQMLSISPLMHFANLCVLHFPFFLFAVFFFFMAQFPFQRTISANWWTVGSRVRSSQSKTLFFFHIDNPSLANENTDSFSSLSVSCMDSQLQSQEKKKILVANPVNKSCFFLGVGFSLLSISLKYYWNYNLEEFKSM